jgi:ABC-type arginine/histidine transport system permease subunit
MATQGLKDDVRNIVAMTRHFVNITVSYMNIFREGPIILQLYCFNAGIVDGFQLLEFPLS